MPRQLSLTHNSAATSATALKATATLYLGRVAETVPLRKMSSSEQRVRRAHYRQARTEKSDTLGTLIEGSRPPRTTHHRAAQEKQRYALLDPMGNFWTTMNRSVRRPGPRQETVCGAPHWDCQPRRERQRRLPAGHKTTMDPRYNPDFRSAHTIRPGTSPPRRNQLLRGRTRRSTR
jgi:hypothetical protein